MPTKVEKDSVTGTDTTGHEWDGIRELDSPLPSWWLWVFYATIAFSIVYYVLYPSLPGVDGILGYNSRVEIEQKLEEVARSQADKLERIASGDLETVANDQELRRYAMAGGRAAFADNCQPCHGAGGAGQRGYPSLADDVWLWGGSLEAIQYTLNHGIRWAKDFDTRYSEMPAFGRDGLLEKADIAAVTTYVQGLSGRNVDTEMSAKGSEIYAEQCIACHGEQGEGVVDFGAPALNDQIWLYGGSTDDIASQIGNPKHGVMPAWSGRLDEATVKMLAIYVHGLGGGQ